MANRGDFETVLVDHLTYLLDCIIPNFLNIKVRKSTSSINIENVLAFPFQKLFRFIFHEYQIYIFYYFIDFYNKSQISHKKSEAMQEEEDRRNFIMGHILFNSRVNFYQINMSKSQNMMRLYDHEGNLRMVRHIDLPENCNQVYSCGEFLIILQNSQRMLYVMDLTSPGFSVISCKNTQINKIHLCVYNESANLFFLLDDQRKVYYLMCTLTTIQIKFVLECNQFIEIDKMYISSEEIFQTSQNLSSSSEFKDMDETFNVYLFSSREKKLITYQVDSSDDKLKSMKIKQNIYDVYFQNNWVLVAEERKQNYEDSERQSEISIKNDKKISLSIKGQGQYMNNFLQSDFPIKIASTPSSFLIFGSDYHMVAFIHQKEWESFKIDKSIIIPQIKQLLKKENEFLFKINKLGLEKFELQLWVFDGINSIFRNYSKRLSKCENLNESRPFGSPLRNQMQEVMQIQENGNLSKERDPQNPLIKIHNNIKTIFSLSGEINPAFENQVILYLQSVHSRCNSDKQLILHKKQIGLMLFYTLLKQNPMTLLKLSSSMISHSVWKKSEINPHRQEEVYMKFLQWVYKVIDEVCLQVKLKLPDYFEEQDKQPIKDKQSLQDEEFYKDKSCDMQDQFQRWLKMMRNLVKFISIHKHAVDQNNLFMNKGSENKKKTPRIDSKLQKAKSIYLTIQALQKLENLKVKGITNEKWFHKMSEIQQNYAFMNQQFDQSPPELFNLFFEEQKYTPISIKKVISFMINSQIYIQTSFAYLCLFPPSEKLDELPSIAYLNHQSHLRMLSVLYNCQPHFEPSKIEKIVHSKLDQAASFVMLLPFPENKPFIKQILKLSIQYEQYVTAKQIFKSGFCLFWMKYLNNELSRDNESTTTKKEYMNDLVFIIDCYCKCTKIVEGYQFLKQIEIECKEKILSQTEKESILDKFINTAIKQDKLVLLLKTFAKDKDDHKTIKEQLTRKVSSNTLLGLQSILIPK